jgi:hypothetical protein
MTREELKAKIPHGYSKLIAQRAGVKNHSVSLFLHGKINSVKIEMAALEVLAELSDKKNDLLIRIG